VSDDPTIRDVELHEGWLRVHFGPPASTHADYHDRWLRHGCDGDRHPTTRERIVCSSELPPDVAPQSVSIGPEGRTLRVLWKEGDGGRRSEYPAAWLWEHAYAVGRVDVPPPPSDPASLEVDARRVGGAASHLMDVCRERVSRLGAVVVRGHGADTEALIAALAADGLAVVETHFGRIEDLRTDNTTNRNTDQLGYTDSAVELHTDQPFLERPPRYQVLHCMQPAEWGGDNAVADGRAAARHLESLDAEAFELLCTVPVRFQRRQKAFEALHVGPVLRFSGEGGFSIRYSYFTMDPHRVPFARMEAWYRAYDRFARLLRDPRSQYRFRLEAGDFLLYDNHRMLHARTRFGGSRWVRGVYFDRGDGSWDAPPRRRTP
jgi:gamma-butyrobetaine dioxygenase/trimethyllysine dioxygenase